MPSNLPKILARTLMTALVASSLFTGSLAIAQSRGGTRTQAPEGLDDALETFYRQTTEKQLEGPQHRELSIEQKPVSKTKLFRADPKLLEQKITAYMTLRGASIDAESSFSRPPLSNLEPNLLASMLPEDLATLMRLGVIQSSSVGATFGGLPGRRPRDMQINEIFQMLSDRCPADQRPEKTILEFLLAPDTAERELVMRSTTASAQGPLVTYRVFAESAETAENRLRGILQLIDQGYCRPLQRTCLIEGRKSLEQARDAYAEVARLRKESSQEQAKLAEPSEITEEVLSKLKAEKVLLDVELAGAIAQLKACDALLTAGKEPSATTLQSISYAKVRAEIEAAGITAKLDQMKELIAEGNGRVARYARLKSLGREIETIRRDRIYAAERQAKIYKTLFTLCAPPRVQEDQIVVAPIEWTN